MGHVDDARKVLIEKERRQRAVRRVRVSRPWFLGGWDRLLGWTIGFGRRPLLAFRWLFGLWLFGVLVFWLGYKDGAMRPAEAGVVASAGWQACVRAAPAGLGGVVGCFMATPEGRYYPPFQPLVYSAETLLPVVNLEQRAHWMPDSPPEGGRWWWLRGYLWLHTLAGWALGLLAIAGFSGLVKAD